MPVAHACISCGTSLSRVRARRDPHYGLPLVVCPTCTRACVRRRHPLQAGWRRVRATQNAIRHAGFLTIATSVFLAGAIFGAALTLDFFRAMGTSWTRLHEDVLSGRVASWTIPGWMRGSGEPFSPIMLVLFAVLGGLVLGFGLTHWRKWMLIPLWVALWNVAVFTPLATYRAEVLIDHVCVMLFGEMAISGGRSSASFPSTYDLAAASVYSVVPFGLGLMGASLLRGLADVNARRRWIKRRRLLKRRRESR